MPAAGPVSPLHPLVAGYRRLAVLGLSTLVVLLALNAAAWVALRLPALRPEPGALSYGMEKLRRVYPGWSDAEIRQLASETWSRTYVYEPFTQFREGPHRGRYLNVEPEGFRRVADQGPWPPVAGRWSLFLFGGSTAFGYGLADEDTIASRLQEALRAGGCGDAAVYNLARSNYYSSQERIQFQQLLADGIRPSMAVFVDGLNEFFYSRDEPKFSRRLSYLMAETGPQSARRALARLPIVALLKRLSAADHDTPGAATEEDEPALVEKVLDRWLRSRRLIEALARASGVETLFVWQPVPTWGYDLSHHLFFDAERGGGGHFALSGAGYAEMAARRATAPELAPESGFLWLGGLQAGRAEPLYVDGVHYTAAFSRLIASRIAARVRPLCGVDRGAPRPPDAAAARAEGTPGP